MDMTQYAGSESNYLKASDLQGKTPTVVIDDVALIEFEKDDGSKQVKVRLRLAGKEKELVISATQTAKLIDRYGADSDGWKGQSIILDTEYYPKFDKKGIVLTPLSNQDDPDDDIPF